MKFCTTRTLLQFAVAVSLCAIPLRAQFPATSLCSTGLTPKSPPPSGCLTSMLVNPINPVDGGPIVDGNWQLATPYPSGSSNAKAPNPCSAALTYDPAPVNAANEGWYNPDDQLSQWISPNGGFLPPGWYVYRTNFTVPPAYQGYGAYTLRVAGQLMADDEVTQIYAAGVAGASSTCGPIAAFINQAQYTAWMPFHLSASVLPQTKGFLFFVVYNHSTSSNPTGLRVEFTSAAYFPDTPGDAN